MSRMVVLAMPCWVKASSAASSSFSRRCWRRSSADSPRQGRVTLGAELRWFMVFTASGLAALQAGRLGRCGAVALASWVVRRLVLPKPRGDYINVGLLQHAHVVARDELHMGMREEAPP